MRVKHLSLANFRNYRTAEVALEPGPTLFVGKNGQGKTNLVEAIGFLSSQGSHRVSTDQALIRQGEEAAIIRARLAHEDREVLLEVQINRSSANRAQVNRSPVKQRELPRYFSSVLFAPEDLALIKGDPSGRRRFLDQLLVLRSPRLASVIADYERVLKQRNTLLKTARASGMREKQLSTLEIWDESLVKLGTEIIVERDRLVGQLRAPMRNAYEAVAGADHGPRLRAHVTANVADPGSEEDQGNDTRETPGELLPEVVADNFHKALKTVRRNELDRGITLIGPHRDDLVFELNGLPAKGYASHGESWSFALSLKLAAAELLRSDSYSGDPVLILDDVFAELDARRRTRLASAIGGYEQVLVTAAVLEDIPTDLIAHVVHIHSGEVVEEAAHD